MNTDNCGFLASLGQAYGMFHSETPLCDTLAARLAVMHVGLLSRISTAYGLHAHEYIGAPNCMNCENYYPAVKDSQLGLRCE